jgi:hypothetical protein
MLAIRTGYERVNTLISDVMNPLSSYFFFFVCLLVFSLGGPSTNSAGPREGEL